MKSGLKPWVKTLVSAIVALALIDLWRDWPWVKKIARIFVKKNEGPA